MPYPEHLAQGPLVGPGSPPRPPNGSSHTQLPRPGFGPRTMLPPSPNFPPRYSQNSSLPTTSPTPNPNHDARVAPPLPQTRPGSSMSIMSMLGSDPERPNPQNPSRQQTPNHHPSSSATSMSLGAVMSPPQHPSKIVAGDYTYKPRSQTPDRVGYPLVYGGTRQYRSSSGTMMQRPSPLDDPFGAPPSRPSFSRLDNQPPYGPEPNPLDRRPASAEHSRRSSINAILQPPDAAPQPISQSARPSSSLPFAYGRTDAGHQEAASNGLYNSEPNLNGQHSSTPGPASILQQNGSGPLYDTRPPEVGLGPRQEALPTQGRQSLSNSYLDGAPSQPPSPESRRQALFRNLGGQSNGQQMPYSQADQGAIGSQYMARQDSAQSQHERAIFGERIRRRFSPFASSVTSQPFSSVPPEDRNRKGSDESSQHRSLLGLGTESKRGRYSPLPQAVHGAQAQTPTPDSGIKDEHGRVFSGIGSGIGSNTSGITSGPPGLSASPFKRDEGVARLSEDNLMKISRSTPGISKRPRKLKDDDDLVDHEDGRRMPGNGRGVKRSKYSHYNLNGEDLLQYQRRNTPSTGLNFIQRTSTPGAANPTTGQHRSQQQHTSNQIPQPLVFKPNISIKISSVLQIASRKPRRHLGSYLYSPKISVPENGNAASSKRAISVEPNLLPSFDSPEHVNCTYTIRVSRTWLRPSERQAICITRALWGSGIYSDDSDPVAAAIHSGFIKASFDESIDTTLLARILKEQNPKIDGGSEHVPAAPVEPPPGKDCQITVVVLPLLETYGESVRYGLRSRKWPEEAGGAAHDGVSFMILNTRWVDEGSQKGKERHGALWKTRFRNAAASAVPKSKSSSTTPPTVAAPRAMAAA